MHRLEHAGSDLPTEKIATGAIETDSSILCCRHVLVPKLVVSSDEVDTVWEADFEGKQQRDHFDLLLPSVNKVAVEHV